MKEHERRSCIFCGARPVTGEHLVAKWLLEVLDEMESSGGDGGDARWASYYESGGVAESEWKAPGGERIPEVVVNCVCENCNSGWMSQLEEAVRPRLESMVRGQPTHIGVVDQTVLGAWAMKTVMVLERHGWPSVVSSKADRAFVRRLQIPPAHSRVRLAHRSQAGALFRSTFFVVKSPHADEDAPDCFTVVLVIGFLIIQVFGGIGWPSASPLLDETTPGPRSIPTYPPVVRGLSWPPPQSVEDEELRRFTLEPAITWAVPVPELAKWWADRPE